MDKQKKPQKENSDQPEPFEMSPKLRALFEERKKAKREAGNRPR